MLRGDLCVPLFGYPGLPPQLRGVGVWYVPTHLSPERGSDGVSQFSADAALGIRQAPCSRHSQAEGERLVVCRGAVNACTLGLSWRGDRSVVGGWICSALVPNLSLLPFAGLERSQRSQGQPLILHHLFFLFDARGEKGLWKSLLHGPYSPFQGEKGRRGIDGIDGMKVNLHPGAHCLA